MRDWLTRVFRRRRRRAAEDLGADSGPVWDAVTERARSDMEARRRALAPLTPIVSSISAALLRADPIGLGDDNADEYDPEAETIVMRLADRREPPAAGDVLTVVHAEFRRWFGDLAGEVSRYEDVAAEVHALWGRYLAAGE